MLLRRFYDTKLAQASYLIGCNATGDALVVDANRDIEQYLRAAEEEGLRVTHVSETHIHADYVSGSRELAARAGASLLLSDEGGSGWRYAFAADDRATLLRDGDSFMVGNVRIDVMHTPGHTPEHICFVITDTPATDRPLGVLTGDFVFAGDVGRPDLLERAANVAGTMEASARTLFASLARFKRLPDYLQLWPGHGAGSACGKALGAVPSTTLGYERIANWGLAVEDEGEFVRQVLAGQPEPPAYFAQMKRINRDGPRLLHGFPRPERFAAARLAELLESGATVVDLRHAPDFAAGHVPGTISIPLNKSFTTWAGWLLPYDDDVYLVAPDDRGGTALDEAVRDLAMIGLDRVAGWFGAEVVGAWAAEGRTLQTVAQITPRELAPRLARGELSVVDVRGASEHEAGHLPGAPNIPLGYLAARAGELDRSRPVVLQCQGGSRSSIAAGVLQAHGFTNVVNLAGGFSDWLAAGLPVERGERERERERAAVG